VDVHVPLVLPTIQSHQLAKLFTRDKTKQRYRIIFPGRSTQIVQAKLVEMRRSVEKENRRQIARSTRICTIGIIRPGGRGSSEHESNLREFVDLVQSLKSLCLVLKGADP
jgi:hypothetical protein